jgi:hypothetical protein
MEEDCSLRIERPQPVQQMIMEKQTDADNRRYDGGEE